MDADHNRNYGTSETIICISKWHLEHIRLIIFIGFHSLDMQNKQHLVHTITYTRKCMPWLGY